YPIVDQTTGQVTDVGLNLGWPAGAERTVAGKYTLQDVVAIPDGANEERFMANAATAFRRDAKRAATGGNDDETVAE
ncbi:MAG: hypothetical protein AAB817_00005, partial [Patescibacteria group bacterium]